MKEIMAIKDFRAILLLMVAVAFLSACSDDSDERNGQQVSFELQPCVRQYQEALPPSQVRNRAWPPEHYELSSESYFSMFADQENLVNRNIGVFFTQVGQPAPSMSQFIYSSGQWYSTFEMEPTTYYLYGYIPYDRNVRSSISLLDGAGKTFADGAKLTLRGLPSFTVSDVCVIVGVKKGTALSDGGIVQGKFEYVVENAVPNHIYLLFNHIYSGLKLSIKVDETYNELRTIKLKEMTLRPIDGSTVKEKMNVTITLVKNGNDEDPTTNVNVVPDDSSNNMEAQPIYKTKDGDPDLTLETSPKELFANFVSVGITQFELVSRYDVYDKNGNLVRKDQEAVNKINLGTLFGLASLSRGTMYTVNLKVNPTYLYVLSDPDLDNPEIVINE